MSDSDDTFREFVAALFDNPATTTPKRTDDLPAATPTPDGDMRAFVTRLFNDANND